MIDYLLKYHCIPSFIKKSAINYLLRQRLKELQSSSLDNFISAHQQGPIAIMQDEANDQHYTQSTAFFQTVLGPKLKYSCCYYHPETKTLADAENNMLKLYCDKLDLKPDQQIFDLGCGWGSFSLYAAQHYPKCQFTALSNSPTQKAYIEEQIATNQLKNLTVICADITTAEQSKLFDKILSVEMFEHLYNWKALLNKVSRWLKPEGQLLIHHFCHQTHGYDFDDGWMASHFFSGGMMPPGNMLDHFSENFSVAERAMINGQHYQKTLDAWHINHLQKKAEIIDLFKQHETKRNSHLHWEYWDLFFRACSQLFAYQHGKEWLVALTLLNRQ